MKKNKKILIIYLAIFFTNIHAKNIVVPGELIAIKLNDDTKEFNSKQLTIDYGIDTYIIFPIAHNQKEFKFNNQIIKIQEKDFGESRITINNLSLVDLNDADAQRAAKESRLIRETLNIYSRDKKPLLNFIKPVDGIISSRYGKKRFINNSPRSPHLALDIAAAEGTAIIAPADGQVVLTGNFFYGGNFIMIDHGHGMLTSYSHLSKITVKIGDSVLQSELIGEVGSTGRVTGPHLHWTVYLNKVRINPESLLKENYLTSLLKTI